MKGKPLWKISVRTVPEAEDAVTEQVQTLFSQAASSYTDAETGELWVSVYLSKSPKPFQPALQQRLAKINDCGINLGSGRIRIQKIRRENWANSWKRHFKPLAIGSQLLIKPSWSKRRARKSAAVIILDPGLSFGTGQHPTTAFCLELLAAHRNQRSRQSLLDIGCGSGILAIAAAKLGYSPVEAFDFDAEAVRIARQNALRNRILGKIRLRHADLTKLPRQCARKHDVICANLISDLLIAERRRLVARLKPGGVLILAGILKIEFGPVQKNFEELGLSLIASRSKKEWRSGAFWFRGTSA